MSDTTAPAPDWPAAPPVPAPAVPAPIVPAPAATPPTAWWPDTDQANAAPVPAPVFVPPVAPPAPVAEVVAAPRPTSDLANVASPIKTLAAGDIVHWSEDRPDGVTVRAGIVVAVHPVSGFVRVSPLEPWVEVPAADFTPA